MSARLGFISLRSSLAVSGRSRGFKVFEQPVETIEEDAIADVVAAFEVLEHLFSPRDFVQHCRRLLRPGGLLVLSCPNVRGFDVATLGVASSTFDHEHLNYFHPESLSHLVSHCGFEVLECHTPGQLDADLVRKAVLNGHLDLTEQPLLREIMIDQWEILGPQFQEFLATNRLSSHMWLIARRDAPA